MFSTDDTKGSERVQETETLPVGVHTNRTLLRCLGRKRAEFELLTEEHGRVDEGRGTVRGRLWEMRRMVVKTICAA